MIDETLPRLFTADDDGKSTRPIRNCRRVVPRRYYGSVLRTVEYPDGVRITRLGKIIPLERGEWPKEVAHLPLDQRSELDEYELAYQKRLDNDVKRQCENKISDLDWNPGANGYSSEDDDELASYDEEEDESSSETDVLDDDDAEDEDDDGDDSSE